MKIGILTFHYAHNYGAVLQAFALKTYLALHGHDAKIINYQNTKIQKNYEKRLAFEPSINDCIKTKNYPRAIKTVFDKLIKQHSWNIQFKKFDSFINSFLLNGDNFKVTSVSQIRKMDFDVIIAGSDQLWNASLTGGHDDFYFLKFDVPAKKVFYAISNGNNYVGEKNYDYYKLALKDITCISTREAELATDINKIFGKAAVGVVDPSFLLCKEDYIDQFSLKKQDKILFAYFIGEDPFMEKVVRVISRALGLEVIELHYYKTLLLKKNNQRADLGPLDFLNCIYSADFVVTNSFHGTAFSIIFHKQFYSVYKSDARKDGLLADLGLSRRHIIDMCNIDLNDTINYDQIKLEEYSYTSKQYLQKSIEIIQ